MNEPIRLLVVVGPTAAGKSAAAIALARRFHGEVISADSMQVYRGLDIGTDKPSAEERAGVPHHCIDLIEPGEPFNVSDYQRHAREAIALVDAAGHLPILAGGTGLYVQAVVDDVLFPDQEADPAIRRRLEEQSHRVGARTLHRRLAEVDPEAAERIHPHNVRRVIRAMEVYERTGVPLSLHQRRSREVRAARPSKYNEVMVGLTRPRAELYERIDRRVGRQVDRGLVQEAHRLYEGGRLRPGTTAGQALGYKEMLDYLDGKVSLQEATAELKRRTRRYAKRQLTWFRRDSRITWFNLSGYAEPESAMGAIKGHVLKQFAEWGE